MKKRKHPYLWLWLLLALALVGFIVIAFIEEIKIGDYTLKQASFKEELLKEEVPSIAQADTLAAQETMPAAPDSTVSSVLIFGDSMTILVARRMAEYGEQNGYTVSSVTWDGSSTVAWSQCDSLDRYIERYKPDFIMVTLGSNELFLKDFDTRIPYINKIVEKFNGIPFVWIGPPNWKEDKGFHDMMERALPRGTYFRSEGLDLKRGRDNIHPTPAAGIIWTDSIMRWIEHTPHPILNELPDSTVSNPKHNMKYIPVRKK